MGAAFSRIQRTPGRAAPFHQTNVKHRDCRVNRNSVGKVGFQLPAAKDCHCESRVARDEAIICTAEAEIGGGTVPRGTRDCRSSLKRQAGSLFHRSLLAMTQDQRLPRVNDGLLRKSTFLSRCERPSGRRASQKTFPGWSLGTRMFNARSQARA